MWDIMFQKIIKSECEPCRRLCRGHVCNWSHRCPLLSRLRARTTHGGPQHASCLSRLFGQIVHWRKLRKERYNLTSRPLHARWFLLLVESIHQIADACLLILVSLLRYAIVVLLWLALKHNKRSRPSTTSTWRKLPKLDESRKLSRLKLTRWVAPSITLDFKAHKTTNLWINTICRGYCCSLVVFCRRVRNKYFKFKYFSEWSLRQHSSKD